MCKRFANPKSIISQNELYHPREAAHAADDEHRIGRRRYLLRAARHLSFPARTTNEVVALLRISGARADVCEVDDARHVEDERPVGEVEPADSAEGV